MSSTPAITTWRAGWRTLAACRHSDPELFFPISSAGPSLEQVRKAKTLCASCQVRLDCLAFAMETGQDHGVWGGTSEDERRALRAQRGRAAPAASR